MPNEQRRSEAAQNDTDDIEIRRGLAQLYLRQQITVQFAVFIFPALMAYVAWELHGGHMPWIWLSGFWTTLVAREIMLRRDAARVADADDRFLRNFTRRYVLIDGAFGLAWGLFPWLALREADPAMDFLCVGLVMGLAAGSASAQAALRWASPAFSTLMLLPFALKSALVGESIYTIGAITILLGIVCVVRFARDNHFILLESFQLRRQNLALAQRLAEEKAAVEESSRIKSLFLAGVSHDLKHPLTALGMYLGYIRARPDDVGRTLGGMQQAIGGMSELLSRLLELSRLESGEVKARWHRVDVTALLQESCRQFAPLAAEKGLRLRLASHRPLIAETDPAMLRSIIDNLIGNAVRYTLQGSILVGLRHRADGSVRLQVMDSGPGIADDALPLLFDAYRRFDDTCDRAREGYGLGLTLVKKHCDLLGYRIDVCSTLGRGSVFSVLMPATGGPIRLRPRTPGHGNQAGQVAPACADHEEASRSLR